MVLSDSTSRIRSSDLTGDQAKDLKAVASGKTGTRYKRAAEVDLADGGHLRNADGSVAWYKLNPPNKKEYIKAGSVLESFSAAGQFDAKTPGGESEGGAGWSAVKGAGDIANAADDPAVEWSRALTTKKQDWDSAHPDATDAEKADGPQGASTGLSQGEGAIWAAGGIFGMAVSMKDMLSDETSAWEKVEAAINFLTSGAATGGAIAQIASTFMEEGSDAAKTAASSSGWLLGYQEMFTTLSAGVKTVKGVIDLVKMVVDDSKHSSAEWVKASGAVLVAGLETVKGVLRSVRQINEVIGGSVTAQFAQVLPGIDIAIAAVKSIVQGFYLVVSAISWNQMSGQKAELVKDARGDGEDKKDAEARISEARKAYRSDSARIANLDALIREKDVKIEAAKKKKAALRDAKKIAAIEVKIAALEEKKAAYQANRNSAAIDSDINEQAQIAKGGPSKGATEEFDLASVLESANQNRVIRQTVHIIANLVAVGASIASLVSGPGAPAAIALKATAMGIDTSLPFFRWVKQEGRNIAARNEAKGEKGISNKIFRGDKSDAAKLADRKKQAVMMLSMIARLNPLMDQAQANQPGARAQLGAQAKRVELYLKASGVEKSSLYALNGNPAKQVLLLVKAISQRELD